MQAMQTLFPDLAPPRPALPPLPRGFRYDRDFLSPAEEGALLRQIAGLELQPAAYHEYTARRKTVCFGLGIRFGGTLAERELTRVQRPEAPEFLQALAGKVARHFGLRQDAFPHVLVTEYPPGAPIGWHRDAPPFAAIYGVSLLSDCTFRLRPYVSPLERGKAYVDEVEASVLGLRGAGPAPAGRRARRPARQSGDGSVALTVEPRSVYAMTGSSRSDWQHSISPVRQTRYSITLRTL
jgi:alkylated DNA repair dioxygenase AlkB